MSRPAQSSSEEYPANPRPTAFVVAAGVGLGVVAAGKAAEGGTLCGFATASGAFASTFSPEAMSADNFFVSCAAAEDVRLTFTPFNPSFPSWPFFLFLPEPLVHDITSPPSIASLLSPAPPAALFSASSCNLRNALSCSAVSFLTPLSLSLSDSSTESRKSTSSSSNARNWFLSFAFSSNSSCFAADQGGAGLLVLLMIYIRLAQEGCKTGRSLRTHPCWLGVLRIVTCLLAAGLELGAHAHAARLRGLLELVSIRRSLWEECSLSRRSRRRRSGTCWHAQVGLLRIVCLCCLHHLPPPSPG